MNPLYPMFDACKVLSHRSFAKREKKLCKCDGSWALGLLQHYLDDFRDFKLVIKHNKTKKHNHLYHISIYNCIA